MKQFSQKGRAEFRRRDNDLDTHTEIVVSPEDDIELQKDTHYQPIPIAQDHRDYQLCRGSSYIGRGGYYSSCISVIFLFRRRL